MTKICATLAAITLSSALLIGGFVTAIQAEQPGINASDRVSMELAYPPCRGHKPGICPNW